MLPPDCPEGQVGFPPAFRSPRAAPGRMTLTQTFVVRPIESDNARALQRTVDTARTPPAVVAADRSSPVRCCLRASRPGEPLLLASYAPLRRWASARGIDPAAYDEVGPVFIHPAPCGGADGTGFPVELRGTPRVMRAYDGNGRI